MNPNNHPYIRFGLLCILSIALVTLVQKCDDMEVKDESYDCLKDINTATFQFEGYNESIGIQYDYTSVYGGSAELLLEKDKSFLMDIFFKCDSTSGYPTICDLDYKFEDMEINIEGKWTSEQALEEDIVMTSDDCFYGTGKCRFVNSNRLKGSCTLVVSSSSIPLLNSNLKGEFNIYCYELLRNYDFWFNIPINNGHELILNFGYVENYDLLNSK